MNSPRFLLLFLLALALSGADALAGGFSIKIPAPSDPLEAGVRGELLVKVDRKTFARGLTPAMFGEAGARYGIYEVGHWLDPKLLLHGMPMYKMGGSLSNRVEELGRILKINYSALDAPEDVALAIAAMPGVIYAEPVYPRIPLHTPNDPDLFRQWHLDSLGMKQAWDLARGDSSIIVAITDTGIEQMHEDLRDAIWYNPNEAGEKATNNVDDDGNGMVDDWWGYDFAGQNGTGQDNDPSGAQEPHGTRVAGIVGAQGNNLKGGAGVAFGVKLMAVKVTNDFAYPNTKVFNGAQGVLYAAKNGAKIINCSWGGRSRSRAEEEVFVHVIRDLKKLVVAAAGNDDRDVRFYPAAYPGVLSVSGLTQGSFKASFSNYNYDIDISAPGTDIYSTTFVTYGYDGGTSYSAPMISGLAALLLKRYPQLSNQSGEVDVERVQEIILASSADISAQLGLAYADKMGAGRADARRAVENGMDLMSARMVEYRLDETTSDGVVDAGETITIRADIRNILADAPNVNAALECISDPSLQITGTGTSFGPMTSGEMRTTPGDIFRFTLPSSIAPNTELVFRLSVQTPDRINRQYIILRAAPTWMTTDHNKITATFNSVGNIGYNGLNRQQGEGIRYGGSPSLFFHGGLMIGTDPAHLPNVVRYGGNTEGVEDGFRAVRPYRLVMAQDSSIQTGTAEFNDAHLPEGERLGINVAMTTREHRSEQDSNILLITYRIKNESGAAIQGLRCGLYLDWDISSSGYNDQTGYDSSHKLIYQRNIGNSTVDYYVGATLLSNQELNFYGADNDAENITVQYTREKKWETMTSGIHTNMAITDAAFVISGGPISLAPNESADVVFAIFASHTFDSLRASSNRARMLYQGSSVDRPEMIAESQVIIHPNPFGAATTIAVTMERPAAATLTLYNLRGEPVASIFNGNLVAGRTEIPFAAGDLPSGAYIYELRTPHGTQRGKLLKQE